MKSLWFILLIGCSLVQAKDKMAGYQFKSNGITYTIPANAFDNPPVYGTEARTAANNQSYQSLKNTATQVYSIASPAELNGTYSLFLKNPEDANLIASRYGLTIVFHSGNILILKFPSNPSIIQTFEQMQQDSQIKEVSFGMDSLEKIFTN